MSYDFDDHMIRIVFGLMTISSVILFVSFPYTIAYIVLVMTALLVPAWVIGSTLKYTARRWL